MADSTRTTRSATRSIGSVVAAMLLTIGVLATGIGAAGAADNRTASADGGAAWLATQLDADLPLIVFGGGDWGATLDAGLALAATGTGRAQVDAIWSGLETDPAAVITIGGSDSPGRIAKAILLAHALGKDPRAVGGIDLVARLEATMRTEPDADAGLFGTGFPGYDGAYRQGLALAALSTAGATPDPLAVTWLLDQQCVGDFGGAWMAYRSDTSTPCAYDFNAFSGPDTNATALAIGGLAAVAQGTSNVAAGLVWLDSVQLPTGGWEQMEGFGQDANSTSLVMQAIAAAPSRADVRFDDQDATPIEALLGFQLGCSAVEADRGAFVYQSLTEAPNPIATVQAVPAAAGAGFIIEPGSIGTELRPLDCTPPTTPTTEPTTPTTEPTTSTTAPTTSTTVTSTTLAPTTTVAAGIAGGSSVTSPPVVGGSSTVRSSGTATSSGSASSGSSRLATTGSSTDLLIPLGIFAALCGGVLLIGSRRLRSS